MSPLIGVGEVAGGKVIQKVNAWFMLYNILLLLCNNIIMFRIENLVKPIQTV